MPEKEVVHCQKLDAALSSCTPPSTLALPLPLLLLLLLAQQAPHDSSNQSWGGGMLQAWWASRGCRAARGLVDRGFGKREQDVGEAGEELQLPGCVVQDG